MDPAPRSIREFILNVPQLVPESWCLECRICCRFPAVEDVQTPFWSRLEADWALQQRPGEPLFAQDAGSPSLAPKLASCGESGYRCPAFEPQTNRCSIHAVKPLDCRLYPFVLTHNAAGDQALLAMDLKCPFIEKHLDSKELSEYAAGLAEYFNSETAVEYLKLNPRVVGPAWPEYFWVSALPLSTGWIQKKSDARPPHPLLRPVRVQDLPGLAAALQARPHSASHYALASLLGWSDLIALWWLPLAGGMALYFEQAGGLFMPVPPLGFPDERSLRQAWELLCEVNRGAAVSRIEGIEAEDRALFERLGFTLKPADKEYIYETAALARLAGDEYKSQRWAVNRASRGVEFNFRPFEERDLVAALQLFTRWAIRRQSECGSDEEKRMLRDSLFFHRRLMLDRDRLGLLGRVLESEGKVLAYTFGAAVSNETFCVLAEIADRDVPGLAQAVFREFCRELKAKGYHRVNTMGDSGSATLRQAKLSYRPVLELEVFTASKE